MKAILLGASTLVCCAMLFVACTEKIIEYHDTGTPDKPTQNDQYHGDIVGRVLQKQTGAYAYISQATVIDSVLVDSATGVFTFHGVRLGNYDLTIKAGNYRIYMRSNVIVPGGGIGYVGEIDLSRVPDLIADIYPADNAEIVYDNRWARLSISVLFTRPMDRESVERAFSTDPPSTGTFYWGTYAQTPMYRLYVDGINREFAGVDPGAVITTFSKITAFTYVLSRRDSYVDTTYGVRLTTEAHDTTGNHLRFPLQVSFRTVQSAVTVYGIQTDPIGGDLDVALINHSGIQVTFPRRMNQASTEQAISITPNDMHLYVWPAANKLTIYTGGLLRADALYTVTIDSTAKDLDGISLGERVTFSFRTAPVALASTQPMNAELFVSTHPYITMFFNTYVVKSSVEGAFTISPPVQGYFQWGTQYGGESKNAISFVPTQALVPNTLYRVTVGTGARDIYGTSLKQAYTFSFITRPE